MRAKIVFQDNSWIVGKRVSFWDTVFLPETPGTHHWWVESFSADDNLALEMVTQIDKKSLKPKVRVAVPFNSMKYMVFLQRIEGGNE
jgi:hypothetical protein